MPVNYWSWKTNDQPTNFVGFEITFKSNFKVSKSMQQCILNTDVHCFISEIRMPFIRCILLDT